MKGLNGTAQPEASEHLQRLRGVYATAIIEVIDRCLELARDAQAESA